MWMGAIGKYFSSSNSLVLTADLVLGIGDFYPTPIIYQYQHPGIGIQPCVWLIPGQQVTVLKEFESVA